MVTDLSLTENGQKQHQMKQKWWNRVCFRAMNSKGFTWQFYPFLWCLVAQMERCWIPVYSNISIPNTSSIFCALNFTATAKSKSRSSIVIGQFIYHKCYVTSHSNSAPYSIIKVSSLAFSVKERHFYKVMNVSLLFYCKTLIEMRNGTCLPVYNAGKAYLWHKRTTGTLQHDS